MGMQASRLAERAPWLIGARAPIRQAAASEWGPKVNQRLETAPPVGVNVATPAFKKKVSVRFV